MAGFIGMNMKDPTTELGARVRELRLAQGLTQAGLNAQIPRLGSNSNNIVSAIEIGKRVSLSLSQLKAMADALQVETGELRRLTPADPDPTTKFGILVRASRDELGLSYRDLAQRMGISTTHAKRLELLHHGVGTYSMAKRLASALGTDPSIFAKFVARQTEKDTESEVGTLIRTHRKSCSMSMGEFAERLGCTRQYISLIERGRKINLSSCKSNKMLVQIAQILELDLGKLQQAILHDRSERRKLC